MGQDAEPADRRPRRLDLSASAAWRSRPAGSEVFDIGGPEVMTYREMMLRFAGIEGLKRYIIDVPVLTPRLSAYWVNLMTPVPAGIAFPLIEGLKSEMICEDDRIRRLIPLEPIGFDEAVRRALDRTRQHDVQTRWTNASGRRRPVRVEFNPDDFPIQDEQVVEVERAGRGHVRPGSPGRRGRRLVLRRSTLADPGMARPADRRRRPAPRPSGPGESLDRRRHRLLAGRRLRAESPAAPARRDEGPRRRLAGVPRPTPGRTSLDAGPDGLFPPHPVLGPALLEFPLPAPSSHFPRHGPEHRQDAEKEAAQGVETRQILRNILRRYIQKRISQKTSKTAAPWSKGS